MFVEYFNVDAANSYFALGSPLTEVKIKNFSNKGKRSLHLEFQEKFGTQQLLKCFLVSLIH